MQNYKLLLYVQSRITFTARFIQPCVGLSNIETVYDVSEDIFD